MFVPVGKLRCALVGPLVILLTIVTPTVMAQSVRPFQKLWIPPAIDGKSFELTLSKSTKSFWAGATTDTYGFNGSQFWGPTLIFNQGDTVQIKVRNDLNEPTTVHWHGLHIPAAVDGGPYEMIERGGTWTPSFTVRNNAATYWYHPHPHGTTQKQLTLGAGGLIIIKDPVESALPLPRTYGVDDIPLVFTSRRFHENNQFNYDGNNVKYGDYPLANGTLDAQATLPAQVVRLRILNAEIERGYIIGFRDNRAFHLIATDGGLVDMPIPLTRIKLMVGERAEILVDLGADKPGSSVDLMAFNSNQAFGFPGGEPQRGGANGSLLNNIDFRLLNIQVTAPTDKPITKIPATLTQNHFWTDADVTNRRSIKVNGTPPFDFYFDDEPFDMHSTDQVQIVKLGAVEAWTIRNNNVFGHSFHIHDVQFKIIARSDGPVADYEQGWKDTVYVPRARSVTFVAKFEDFASDTEPYMYHCHMANHEDAGLMGNFLVVNDPAAIKLDTLVFRNRIEHPVTLEMIAAAERTTQTPAPAFQSIDVSGRTLSLASLTEKKPVVLFFIERECPCSQDAAVFLDRLQTAYGEACTVVGIINASPEDARAWAKQAGVHFPIIPDLDQAIITAYDVKQSVYTTVVAPGGKIVRTYPGYSTDMLTELSATVAKLGGVPVHSFALNGAPKQLLSGCVFAPLHPDNTRARS